MKMNTIVGQAATGDKFYKRPGLIKAFWSKIYSGNNILISAPRRVGKTSFMLYLKDQKPDGYQFIFLLPESVNNKNEYYQKIYYAIYETLNNAQKFKKSLATLIQSKTIKSIGPDGITFDEKEIDYFRLVANLLKGINLENDKLIVMIDDF